MSAPARSVAAGSGPPRVLLVHANPFQRVTPVPAYGLERLRTAIEPTGAEVELIDPYLFSRRPAGRGARYRRAVSAGRDRPRHPHHRRLHRRRPAGGARRRADRRQLPAARRSCELRGALAGAAPKATFIAGGAGFSACPQECLEYLGVEHGVVGAGEGALTAMCEGQSLDEIPGVVRRGRARRDRRVSPRLRRPDASRPSLCARPTRSRCGPGSAAPCSASTARPRTSAASMQTATSRRCSTRSSRRSRLPASAASAGSRSSSPTTSSTFRTSGTRSRSSRASAERGLDEAPHLARVLQPDAVLGGVRRARSRDERTRLDHRRQRRRRTPRDGSEAFPAPPPGRPRRAALRARCLGRPRAHLRPPGRDRGDDRRDDRLRPCAAARRSRSSTRPAPASIRIRRSRGSPSRSRSDSSAPTIRPS